MRAIVIAMLLWGLCRPASSCSLVSFSEEFRLQRNALSRQGLLPPIEVASLSFVPWLSDSGSCDGVGWLAITLSSPKVSASRLREYGYIIRAVSGVNDPDLFPRHPLDFIRHGSSRTTLFWGWTGITPGPDGHVRWNLELTPVTRSGLRGAPIPICVSSNNSCPQGNGGQPLHGR